MGTENEKAAEGFILPRPFQIPRLFLSLEQIRTGSVQKQDTSRIEKTE